LLSSTTTSSAEAPEALTTTDDLKVPSMSELLKFGFPILCIWLLQPILSLIDTSVVGINPSSTVAELAALGPGIAFIDSSSYLFQFMGMATTNLYANALSEQNQKKSEQVLSRSVMTALFFGLFLMTVQFTMAGRAITALSGAAVESIPFGIQYARIRAFAAPVALPTIVAQAAFLAAKDAVTPLKATLIGALANLMGDILLVTILKQGVAGAALATAVSQYVGAFYLAGVAILRISSGAETSTSIPTAALINSSSDPTETSTDSITTTSSSFSGGGGGGGPTTPKTSRRRNWSSALAAVREKVTIPSMKDILSYLQFCGPLFAVLLIKTFLWSYTTFACAAAGAVQLAAHQITINLFLFFCIFGDVVSQLSQTYLPYFLNPSPSPSPSLNVAGDALDLVEGDIDIGDAVGDGSGVVSNSIIIPNEDVESGVAANVAASDLTIANKPQVISLVKRMLQLALGIGCINSIGCQVLKRWGNQMFTNSAEVIAAMGSASNLLSLATICHASVIGIEGVLLAFRDFRFLSILYGIIGVLFVGYQTTMRQLQWGITGVWSGTVLYQYTRVIVFATRLRQVLRRPDASGGTGTGTGTGTASNSNSSPPPPDLSSQDPVIPIA